MTTGDQMSSALAPGSIEYGKRRELETMIGGVMANRRRQTSSPQRSTPPAPGAQGGSDQLLELLTSGQVTPLPNLPMTDGLSVGPGAGPPAEVDPNAIPTDLENRLRLVAMNAKTPHLRAMARMALRREVRRRMGSGV